jgi:hypothetical protein
LLELYPYQILTPAPLRGEGWKDVPGFEGYYQASTKGRVRSLDRTIPHPRLKQQFVKGRILSQSIAKNKNNVVGDETIDLRVSLNLEGTQSYYNVRRLIYFTFKERIDFSKDGSIILNKDGDGYNCSLSNLKKVSMSGKQKRVFKRGRNSDYLSTADRTKWETQPGHSKRKPIIQMNLEGIEINRFISVTEAALKTGFGEKEIIEVAKERRTQYHGFKWKYKNGSLQ